MIDQKYIDLMNTEIDGVNTAEQSRELRAFLESGEEGRLHFEGLRATAKAIDSVRTVSAPPGLFNRIMSRISPPVPHAPYESEGGFGDWLRGLFARPQLRLAGSFAAGLAIGVAIYSAITNDDSFRQPLDLSELAGTMEAIDAKPPTQFQDPATAQRLVTLAKGFDQIADLDVAVPAVSGYIHMHHSGETVIADVALKSDSEIEWSLQYDANEVALDGFRHLGDPGEFSSTKSEARAKHEGENRYVLLFRAHDGVVSAMTLRIYSNNEVVFEHIIPTD